MIYQLSVHFGLAYLGRHALAKNITIQCFLLKIFRCVVTTDNLIADVDADVVQGEVQCQILCNSLSGSWFNFKRGEGCQILRFCNEFEAETGVTTGPNTPPIDSCQKPSPIPKV